MAIYPTPEEAPPHPPTAASPPPPQVQSLPPNTTTDQVASTASTVDTPSLTPETPGPALLLQPSPEEAPRPPKTPICRDSLRQRETLLKGTSGSRRRQRWENDRLLSNPHVIPPTPADFLPTPTHTRKTVHYDLACLWDARYRQQAIAKRDMVAKERQERAQPQIPRELKAGLKKARGAVGMVRMLEERVRDFVQRARDAAEQTDTTEPTHEDGWEVVEHGHSVESEDEHEVDEEDKEVIVFTPRKYRAVTEPTTTSTTITVPQALPVYHSPSTDPSAPFIRWLVHSIAEYYGLYSWSVTENAPPVVGSAAPSSGNGRGEVRVAYVGLELQKGMGKEQGKAKGKKTKRRGSASDCVDVVGKLPVKMPRPLWVML